MKGKKDCTLWMNPRDAEAHGLGPGGNARVRSRVGELVVAVEVTESIMPGVVSLPHGFGHRKPGTRLSVAAAHAGVSVNDLTDELRVDALSGTAAFSGLPVSVEPAT